MTGSPVVELDRAVAVAMADGPAVGLALLQGLEADGALAGYYLLPATQADFLRRPGQNEEAASAYEEAAALAGTGPERRFLNARLGRSQDRSTPEPGRMGIGGPRPESQRSPGNPGCRVIPEQEDVEEALELLVVAEEHRVQRGGRHRQGHKPPFAHILLALISTR
jgi:hypothetical protein